MFFLSFKLVYKCTSCDGKYFKVHYQDFARLSSHQCEITPISTASLMVPLSCFFCAQSMSYSTPCLSPFLCILLPPPNTSRSSPHQSIRFIKPHQSTASPPVYDILIYMDVVIVWNQHLVASSINTFLKTATHFMHALGPIHQTLPPRYTTH